MTEIMDRLLKLPEVEVICGKKKSAIYQGIKEGTFPAPMKIGKRSVAWASSDIRQWRQSLPKIRGSVEVELTSETCFCTKTVKTSTDRHMWAQEPTSQLTDGEG